MYFKLENGACIQKEQTYHRSQKCWKEMTRIWKGAGLVFQLSLASVFYFSLSLYRQL